MGMNRVIVHDYENVWAKYTAVLPEKWKPINVPSINWIHENIGINLSCFSVKELREIIKTSKVKPIDLIECRFGIMIYYSRHKRLSRANMMKYIYGCVRGDNEITLSLDNSSIYITKEIGSYEVVIPELGIDLKELFIRQMDLMLFEDPNANMTELSYRLLYINENYHYSGLDLTL